MSARVRRWDALTEEVLSWLLPGSNGTQRAGVRRVVTALRLLRDDGREGTSRRVDPPWGRARGELERLQQRQLMEAVDTLLHASLVRLRGPDSFLALGLPCMDVAAAWRILEAARVRPAEPARAPSLQDEAEHWVATGTTLGAPRAWRILSQARVRHLCGPAPRAERHWAGVLRRLPAGSARPALEAACLAGWAAARLERFDPRAVWRARARFAARAGENPTLIRLLGWSAFLCGQLEDARVLLRGSAPVEMALPRALADARDASPEGRELVPGERAAWPSAATAGACPGRNELGALLLALLVPRPEGGVRLAFLDAPRRARVALERVPAAGSDGWAPPGTLERVLVNGQTHAVKALGRARTLALARIPLDMPGARGAWLQVECAHALLPATELLAQLGRAWSRPDGGPAEIAVVEPHPALRTRLFARSDPRGALIATLFRRLGSLAGRRFSWIERGADGTDCLRASAGSVLGQRAGGAGQATALARARARREMVRHAGGAVDALHAAAVAGVVLPLVLRGAVSVPALLVLEVERREALTPGFVDAAMRAVAALEPEWCAATFRALVFEREGRELAWLPRARALAALAPRLRSLALCPRSPVFVGVPGSGRRTLARWFRFLEGLLDPNRPEDGAAVARILELEALGDAAQRALADELGAPRHRRTLFFSSRAVPVLLERGRLVPELAACLVLAAVPVAPLCDRRDEIPALAHTLARAAAARDALEPLRFTEAALAALWRQSWPRGIPQLRSTIDGLTRLHAGREIGAEEVRADLLVRGAGFLARLPSRRPRALDLELALMTTRHRVGSMNRARAARYLGWDPDTLVARLRGADLRGPDLSRGAGARGASRSGPERARIEPQQGP